jgi:hypothetical protein
MNKTGVINIVTLLKLTQALPTEHTLDEEDGCVKLQNTVITKKKRESHLLNFLNEKVSVLQVGLHASFFDSIVQNVIVWRRQLDSGEKIRGDAVEQRQIVVEELWQVDVNDGTEHQHIFVLVRIFQLQYQITSLITRAHHKNTL